MRRLSGGLACAFISLSLMLSLSLGSAANGTEAPEAPKATEATVAAPQASEAMEASAFDDSEVDLPRPVHGATALRLLGDQVGEAAALNDMRTGELTELLRTDGSAWLSQDGMLFYKDPAAEHAPQSALVPAASYPLEDTLTLHSKPGSNHTIFLDFDGATVANTAWNDVYPGTPTVQPTWDPSGDGPSFSADELTRIQAVWASVTEDYAAFDVDVTTADPGPDAIARSSAGDQVYGSWALVTPSGAWASLCNSTCGGVAWVGVTSIVAPGGSTGYGYAQPAFVFPQGAGNSPKAIAEVISHEVGHNMGLGHDGQGAAGYDLGHGDWAPIMGASYYEPITQWSQGSYVGANNQEDDLAIIGSVLGLRTDESTDSIAGAAAVPAGTAYVTSRDDVDTYLLGACTGDVTIAADTVGEFADLDVSLTLLDTTGATVASADPPSAAVSGTVASGMSASITQTLTGATYYIAVDGVGNGPWSTGYDDYASIGAYTVDVTGTCDGAQPSGVPSVPADAVATPAPKFPSVTMTWETPQVGGDSPVTGYVLTRNGVRTSTHLGPEAVSFTWSGLDYETTYTFGITALNSQGPGPTQVLTATTAPYLVPTVPRDFTATWDVYDRRIELAWTPPLDDGGAPVQTYRLYINGSQWYSIQGDKTSFVVPLAFGANTYEVGLAATNRAGTGPQALDTVIVPPPPSNDYFSARPSLSGISGTTTGDNTHATNEGGDPAPPTSKLDAGGASVWYSWTAPTSGAVTFATTSGIAGRDTTLAVYTGSGVGSLVEVAGNDDTSLTEPLAQVVFTAIAGTEYAVAVDGFRAASGGTGPFGLTWQASAAVATTTTLDAEVDGRTVTLTAEVGTPSGALSGTVRFTEGGNEVGTETLASGGATLELTNVGSGDHTYVATFIPDTQSHAGSASSAELVTVAPTPTSTSLDTSLDGRDVTLVSYVTADVGVPAGSVEFRDGTELVGSATLSGGAGWILLTNVSTGDHDYFATYVPANVKSYDPSSSPVETVTIAAAWSSVGLTAIADGNTVTLGVLMYAESGSGTPAGSAELYEGDTLLDTVTLVDGAAELVLDGVVGGQHTYSATYVPAGTTHSASTSGDIPVTVAPTATDTGLSTSVVGRTVTLTATVTAPAGVPAGAVQFQDGWQVLDTVAVTDGTAVLTVTDVRAAEPHDYMASFLPTDDTVHVQSWSPTETVTVEPSTTSTSLDVSVDGHTVTADIAVTSAEGVPEGFVVLREDENTAGSANVDAGAGTVTVENVEPGSHTYTATFYSFNSSYLDSDSPAMTVQVGPPGVVAAPTVTLVDGTATVSWTAADDGGSPILGYAVTSSSPDTSPTPGCSDVDALTCQIEDLVDGARYTFTVHAVNVHGPGAESDPSTEVRVDTSGPTVTLVGATWLSTLTGTAILTWTGTDPSGVDHYDVESRTAAANKPFGAWMTTPRTTTSMTATVAAGATVCVQVRGVDNIGHTGMFTATPYCRTAPLDDRSLTMSGTGAKRLSAASYFRSTATQLAGTTATLKLATVRASTAQLVATTCATCGSVRIYYGTKLVKTLSLRSSTTRHKQVFALPAANTATSIRLTGASATKVWIDGIVLRAR